MGMTALSYLMKMGNQKSGHGFSKQGYMAVLTERKDRDYCRIPPRVIEQGNRQDIQTNKELMRMEPKPKYLQTVLPGLEYSRNRPIYCMSRVSHQLHQYIS